jgi:radical SAM protein with 4Fe4S-binding SPASM domain
MLEMAKENIKAAFEIRNRGNYHTKLYASSIRYDDKQIGEMENFLNQFIVPYVDWNYWLPLYTAGGEAKIIEKSLDMKPMAGNPGRWDDPSDPLPCWTIFTAAHILYDGRVSACCLDGSGHWVMGNMRTQKFMDIWNSQEFQELRQAHLNKDVSGTKCEQCVLI